ncbi:MAG: hypothetical protein ABI673_03040 [Novosphingobium sp.]
MQQAPGGTLTSRGEKPVLLVWGIALVAAALVYRLLALTIATFDADEYAFALVARDILHGKLPYSGVFDNKPVGLNYLFALAEWIGGQSVTAIHALGLAAAALSAWLIHRSARLLHASPPAALALAALFLLAELWLGGWASMSEVIVAPLLCLANLILVKSPQASRATYFGLGLIAGLACQITYLAAPCFGLTVAAMLVVSRDRLAVRLLSGVLATLGLIVAVVAVWLPQITTGDWLEYVREQMAYHGHYRLPMPPGWLWRENFFGPLVLLGLPVLGIWAVRLRGKALVWPSRLYWIIALQLIGGMIAAAASNRLYTHYLILTLPAFALLPAIIAADAPKQLAGRFAAVLLVCASLAALLPLPQYLKHSAQGSVEQDAARIVQRMSSQGSAIFVFNGQHTTYFLSRRAAASRFVFPNHYLQSCDGAQPVKPAGAVLEEGLSARPALLLIGNLCRAEIDADTVARQHGYGLVDTAARGDKVLRIYAPIIPSPERLPSAPPPPTIPAG